MSAAIFGVRGLNSGLEDVNNLAWKLAGAIRGWSGERLLDTYTAERLFAMRENMRHASKSAEFMAPPAPAFALMRSAVLGLAGRHPWVRRLIDPRQSTTVGYPDSPLNQPEAPGEFAAGPASGFAFLDGPLDDGTPLCRCIGPGFTALAFDAPALAGCTLDLPGGAPVQLLAASAGGVLGTRYDARPGTVYLFRPDGNLLARWRSADVPTIQAAVRLCCEGGAA